MILDFFLSDLDPYYHNTDLRKMTMQKNFETLIVQRVHVPEGPAVQRGSRGARRGPRSSECRRTQYTGMNTAYKYSFFPKRRGEIFQTKCSAQTC